MHLIALPAQLGLNIAQAVEGLGEIYFNNVNAFKDILMILNKEIVCSAQLGVILVRQMRLIA